jgi:hypothetical protein
MSKFKVAEIPTISLPPLLAVKDSGISTFIRAVAFVCSRGTSPAVSDSGCVMAPYFITPTVVVGSG